MKAQAVTAGILIACFAGVAVRERQRSIEAADRDVTAWGAADPSWSPDGRSLAFTLYGSIWTVEAQGGVARQISTGAGYDAHPAWSPKDGRIAFIRGNPPAGPLPDIRGRLTLVDLESGEERTVSTPHPTSGTPSWAPDGERVACGLAVPDSGSLVHEIAVDLGTVRPLQERSQRGPAGGWTYSAWGPKGEVFVSGQRFAAVTNGSQFLGSPQIWSVPAAERPFALQLPLTRYRLADIAQLHSLSPLPDGSAVVYSAVIVNGKGDRELYRVPAEGGTPVALTNTPRDEFSPAVSPDGKQIAHVSNHLGNLDLFLMPAAGGAKSHVRITGLKFRAPSGRLRLRTLDETGQPSPVRLFVKAADGKAYGPQGSPLFYYAVEMGGPREGFFVTRGSDEFALPAGKVSLTASKGVEYRLEEQSVDIEAGKTAEVTIRMQRWTNWSQKGWWTGEDHFHANYNGSYYQRPPDSLAWLEAEDLNAANMIVANSEGAFVHDKEFFKGMVDPLSKPRFILYWGQEYRNSDPLGHMAFLNIRKQVPPSYTSVVGSDSRWDYPLNTMAALDARRQGGLVVYVHPHRGIDVFNTGLGAKEAPVTAALGAMDGIDVLPGGGAAYQMWYRLLNAGFRISPGAGTDVFTNWRGINRVPGGARQYVEVGPGMDWKRWVERFRQGRDFVTNGPLITYTANGQPMGSVIEAPAGQAQAVKLAAEVTARGPLDRVEVLRNGEVIDTKTVSGGSSTFRLEREETTRQSAWYAVRVVGKPMRGLADLPIAHTAPVYVHIGGEPVLLRQDVALMIRWIHALWAYLEERNNFGPGENKAKARAMIDQALAHYQAKLKGAI